MKLKLNYQNHIKGKHHGIKDISVMKKQKEKYQNHIKVKNYQKNIKEKYLILLKIEKPYKN